MQHATSTRQLSAPLFGAQSQYNDPLRVIVERILSARRRFEVRLYVDGFVAELVSLNDGVKKCC